MRIVVQAWRAIGQRARRRVLGTLWFVAFLVVAVAVLCHFHAPSADAVRRTILMATGLAMTPVILETTLWITGFFLVGGLAFVRMQLERRDWELAEAMGGGGVAEPGKEPGPIDVEALLAAAEGHLEMGELPLAWETLMGVPRDAWDDEACVRLRVRWAMLAHRWREGDQALELLEGKEGSAEVVARYLVAKAADVEAVAETGESGNAQARRSEVRRLRDEAKKVWPQIANG